MMDYREAIAYLYGLTDYEKIRVERYTPETLDLSRVERLLAGVGDPHTQFPSVHIAGTKGKGSVAAMVEACLRAAGHRTGFYISPHLHTFRERMQVDRRLIAQEDVVGLVETLRPAAERVPEVTYFEAVTAMGFLHFARSGVDVAVVEVGLGGRLDATNVLTPEVTVITSLSLEHTYLLGDTLVEIAREKAGIVKPGVPAVSAPQRPEAAVEIAAICEARNAPLTVVGRDWRYEAGPADLDGQMMSIRSAADGGSPLDGEYRLSLLGRHQLENAACAIGALDLLRGQGYDITAAAVAEGLGGVCWPGRFEVLEREPLVVADGAHTPYSMDTLCRALEAWFPRRRWVVVFGASADKDVAGMMERLLPISDYVIVTRSDHPRGAAPVELADVVASAGGGAEVSVNVKKAMLRGLDCLTPETGLLVTGSLHLVADAREVWAEYMDRPVPANDNDEDSAHMDKDPHVG